MKAAAPCVGDKIEAAANRENAAGCSVCGIRCIDGGHVITKWKQKLGEIENCPMRKVIMILRKKIQKTIRKGSFTVEAAAILPLLAAFIALLLGFIYFTHQQNWCRGAAFESIYYALQRNPGEKKIAGLADMRLKERIAEAPMSFTDMQGSTSENAFRITAEIKTEILPDVFGDRFSFERQCSAKVIDPCSLKRTAWVAGYASGESP